MALSLASSLAAGDIGVDGGDSIPDFMEDWRLVRGAWLLVVGPRCRELTLGRSTSRPRGGEKRAMDGWFLRMLGEFPFAPCGLAAGVLGILGMAFGICPGEESS